MRAGFRAERPLQIVVVDHVKVDVGVIDEDTGENLGRPWLTIAIDAFTRMVTGFHLAMTPPSRISVSMCLLQSVCGKSRWLAERGVEGSWPVAGIPETLRLDAQSFYGLRNFGRICANMEIQAVSNAGREHKYGVHVESLIGPRIGDVRLSQGRDLTERATFDWRDPAGARYITLRALERHLAREIVQRYHVQRHPALRRPPITLWREHESAASLRAPADCLNFRLSFMPEEDCALERDGVRLIERRYSSQALKKQFEDGVKRLIVKYDPRDLSYVFVRKPSGRYVKAYQEAGAEAHIRSEYSPTGAQSEANGASYAQAIPSVFDSCVGPSNNVVEMVVGPRPDAQSLTRPHDGKPFLAIDSVAQIEQRCGASCPFRGKPQHAIARNSVYGC